MTVLRSALFNLYFFGCLAALLLVLWVVLPLKRAVLGRVASLWARSVCWGLAHLVGLDHQVLGGDNLPAGGAVYACKHQSAWDTVIFLTLFGDAVYVLKRELLSIPLWGWYARKHRSIAVDRAGGAGALKKMVRDTRAALAEDRAVVIFPEGTRMAPGTRRPYHPGVAALYAMTDAPIIPVALNSGLFWGRRSFVKRPGRITLEFLPAMPRGLTKEQFLATLEERIQGAVVRLEAEAAGRRAGGGLGKP